MRFRLLAVGRLRSGPLKELQALYAARIRPPPAIVEVEERHSSPPVLLRAREGKLILGALPPDTPLIALDATGEQWSSRALADRIGEWRDHGSPELAFAIGGADGLHSTVLERADVTVSLGSMTWPHLLVRGMLLEQLYRAQQILAGHPYHRG
ncbi:MAG: 23S rRNA (pseudouridine(1915)-N(3))-methyltransferase RlmH [Alphaproteobacteria bacterium]|nr:23S rRNA (pseudouridine(1915)-N(3))-methyltransferase RlmH [Alphaproteobacteria bacterium]